MVFCYHCGKPIFDEKFGAKKKQNERKLRSACWYGHATIAPSVNPTSERYRLSKAPKDKPTPQWWTGDRIGEKPQAFFQANASAPNAIRLITEMEFSCAERHHRCHRCHSTPLDARPSTQGNYPLNGFSTQILPLTCIVKYQTIIHNRHDSRLMRRMET